jgi:hypothetical protein
LLVALCITFGYRADVLLLVPPRPLSALQLGKISAHRIKEGVLDDVQLRFVAASEKKAAIMEQQLH